MDISQRSLAKGCNRPRHSAHQMCTKDRHPLQAALTCVVVSACILSASAQTIPNLSEYITQSQLLTSPEITSVFGNVTSDPSALFYFISSQIFAAQATDIFPTIPFLRLLPSAAFYKLRECQRKDIVKCIRYGAGPNMYIDIALSQRFVCTQTCYDVVVGDA
jgi:hypothetical protein